MMLKTLGRIAFVMTALLVCEIYAAMLAYGAVRGLELHPDMAPISWALFIMAAVMAFVVPYVVIEGTR